MEGFIIDYVGNKHFSFTFTTSGTNTLLYMCEFCFVHVHREHH